MDALSNPYTPGAGTKPPALTGRDEQLGHFELGCWVDWSGAGPNAAC